MLTKLPTSNFLKQLSLQHGFLMVKFKSCKNYFQNFSLAESLFKKAI